jgi:hypothetical protein
VALSFSPIRAQAPWRVYLLAATGGVAGLIGLLYLVKRGGGHTPPVMAIQTVLLYSVALFTAYPEINHFKSARPICEPVRTLAEAGVDFDLYSVGFSREEYIYYSQRFHEPVLIGLVGNVPPEALMDQARLQKDAKRTIAKAVDDVPVANLQHVTPEERKALFDAIEGAVVGHEDEAAIRAFEADLQTAITEFFARLTGPAPAFAFVQEEDWRWLVPLYPGDIPATILVDRPVGSRHVLLLANGAAVALLNSSK